MNRIKRMLNCALCVLLVVICLCSMPVPVQAAGFMDEEVSAEHEYSKYPLNHYELDMYIEESGGVSLWNLGDAIGNLLVSVVNFFSNLIWKLSCMLSNLTGMLIDEAYRLDFMTSLGDKVAENIQAIAGINSSGINSQGTGFFPALLGLVVLMIGFYVLYMGTVKKAASKAVNALVSFIGILLIGGSMIAYAPDVISTVNEFSSDMATKSLDIGASIMGVDTGQDGDSVSAIRDNLFYVQIKQPWLILQYGNTGIVEDEEGAERVGNLLAEAPNTEGRNTVAKWEVENGNTKMSASGMAERFVMVLLLLFFNLAISYFVVLLAGILIFSQILNLIYIMVFPVSLLLSMFPGLSHNWKPAAIKIFNSMMMRVGIALILSIAFSLSSMVYTMTANIPFVLVLVVQVIIFAGIYMKLNELLGLVGIQSDGKGFAKQVTNKAGRMVKRRVNKAKHALGHMMHSRKRRQRPPSKTWNYVGPGTSPSAPPPGQQQFPTTSGGKALSAQTGGQKGGRKPIANLPSQAGGQKTASGSADPQQKKSAPSPGQKGKSAPNSNQQKKPSPASSQQRKPVPYSGQQAKPTQEKQKKQSMEKDNTRQPIYTPDKKSPPEKTEKANEDKRKPETPKKESSVQKTIPEKQQNQRKPISEHTAKKPDTGKEDRKPVPPREPVQDRKSVDSEKQTLPRELVRDRKPVNPEKQTKEKVDQDAASKKAHFHSERSAKR